MKTKFHALAITATLLLAGACAALVSGCASSSQKRISQHQQLFDSLPPETQAGIRAGRVEIGYTPEMVLMAVGKPNRQFTRTTAQGVTEVWVYTKNKPSLGFGFGIGGGTGRGVGVGTGVGIGMGGGRAEEVMRIVFEGGKVGAIEGKAAK